MKSIEDMIRDFRASKAAADKVARDLPRISGQESVLVINENFRLEAYDSGNGKTPWSPREEKTNKSYDRRYNGVKGSTVGSHNKILHQIGTLQNNIDYRLNGKTVTVGVNEGIVPYAKIHNEGLQGRAFGKYTFRMKRRQFQPTESEGPNKKILDGIRAKIAFQIDKAFQYFKSL